MTGAVTRADGSFRVEGLRPGAYYLRVSRLGYTTSTVPQVAVTPSAQTADVGIVRLAAGAVALQGITATTERSEVITAPDRTVVSTRNMPAVTGGNATDVLRNVPGVDVDGDGKVSLRGNQNVAIQINGRPAPLTGDALTNFIKPAAGQPGRPRGGRSQPLGQVRSGRDGRHPQHRAQAERRPGHQRRPDGGRGDRRQVQRVGEFGHQAGPLTLFGSYGFNRDERTGSASIFRDQHFDGFERSLLDQASSNDFANLSHTVNWSDRRRPERLRRPPFRSSSDQLHARCLRGLEPQRHR